MLSDPLRLLIPNLDTVTDRDFATELCDVIDKLEIAINQLSNPTITPLS